MIRNCVITKAEINPLRNGTGEYVRLEMENADDVYDEIPAQAIFDQKIVDKWKAELAKPEVNGDVSKVDPKLLHFNYVEFKPVTFPEPHYRIWDEDGEVTLRDGRKLPHKAGEIVKDKFGIPVVYLEDTIMVKHLNGTNLNDESNYAKGWSPTERTADLMRRYVRTSEWDKTHGINVPGVADTSTTAPVDDNDETIPV